MKILISVSHPAHVHLFKNLIWILEKKGYDIKIVARNKEICTKLLDIYGFEYKIISSVPNSFLGMGTELLYRTKRFIAIIKKYNPDLVLSGMDPSLAIASKICGKKYVSLADTEHAKLIISIALPFTNIVLTPSCFKKDFGDKQIRYEGYHELAYLHPNFFQPNPNVLSELGLTENDTYIIMRFISWSASHDVGQHGIREKIKIVEELGKYARILITSEGKLDPKLEKFKIKVSPEKLHDLLYYAALYVGDGGTTASECSVLGTPAVFISTIACGYQYDEEKYELLYLFQDPNTGERDGLKKALELLHDTNLKQNSLLKRKKLLADKIDVTAFMVQFIENYVMSGN